MEWFDEVPFMIGCADAAHQVEGNLVNDWTVFEETHPEAIADRSRSGIACDTFHRYEEDLDRLVDLHANAYRFSIEWSRVEPHEGVIDAKALEHYRKVIAACRERGLEPIVTLHHFTLPVWLAHRGGILADDVPYAFARYVAACVAALGDVVTWWVTINEPNVLAVMAYLYGYWPPQEHSLPKTMHAFAQLTRMHAAGAVAIHDVAARNGWTAHVSFAHHIRPFKPVNSMLLTDAAAAASMDWLFNAWILEACRTGKLLPPIGLGEEVYGLRDSLDYLAINHYTGEEVHLSFHGADVRPRQGYPLTENNLAIDPLLFESILISSWDSYHLPILVTENGVADPTDSIRSAYLEDHLHAVKRARSNGIPVLGYCYWSLLDNFEWHEGYSMHFGLFAVDRETLERTPRPSTETFARLAGEMAGAKVPIVPR